MCCTAAEATEDLRSKWDAYCSNWHDPRSQIKGVTLNTQASWHAKVNPPERMGGCTPRCLWLWLPDSSMMCLLLLTHVHSSI